MVNNVTIPNDSTLVVVSMDKTEDPVNFAYDLKSNLEKFKLGSINSENRSITFSCKSIDVNGNEITCNYYVKYEDKVLIRNKMVVQTNCHSLIYHKILILN